MVEAIWAESRRLLQVALSEKDFDTWIAPLQAVAWAEGEPRQLTLGAPSGFFRDRVVENFQGPLEHAASRAGGGPTMVRIGVDREVRLAAPEAAAAPPAKKAPAARPPVMPGGRASRYTFDTYVVGASNLVAHSATRAVVAAPGSRFNPLFLHGGTGLGKTHLLFATANALGEQGSRVLCLSAESFVNEMVQALRDDKMDAFRKRFRRIDVLVVDDIQFLCGKKRSQEEFTHTFNALYDGRRQIIVASDRPPHELAGLEEALKSRFTSGLLADIQPPDPALRLELVRQKSTALGLALDHETVAYLADHCCDNVRQLEGALARVDAFVTLAGRAPTLDAVRDAIAPHVPRRMTSVSTEQVVGAVCQEMQLSRSELVSPRRTRPIALGRHVAMWLMREHTDAPLETIGRELGGRDHSTVAHGLKTIEERLRTDAALRTVVEAVRRRLAAS